MGYDYLGRNLRGQDRKVLVADVEVGNVAGDYRTAGSEVAIVEVEEVRVVVIPCLGGLSGKQYTSHAGRVCRGKVAGVGGRTWRR